MRSNLQRLAASVLIFLPGVVCEDATAAAPCAGLVGNYIGIWTNSIFQSSGGVEIDISDAGVLTFDLDEFVFGMLDPDPVVVQGMVLGETGSASVMDDSFYGDIAVSVDCSDGSVMATVSDIPGGVFNGVMVSGTIGNGLIDLTYDVDSVMGTDSNGTLVAMPEPSAEGSILAVLLALGGLARRRVQVTRMSR